LNRILRRVTLLELSSNPERFDGETLLVRGNLSGKLVDAGRRYRLAVKGARITSRAEKPQQNGITFVMPKALRDCLPEGLDPATFYPVRLTVTVRRERSGCWVASVTEIEMERPAPRDR
jgi:hypothetical protein